MKDESMSTRNMLLNISTMKHRAMLLAETGKVYSIFLKGILAREDFINENAPMPSVKDLCKSSGLSYGKVRRYIDDIYHDLVLDDEARAGFAFTKVRFDFMMRGRRKRFLDLEANRLPVVPRVGEEVSLPFFSAYLGETTFYVDKVEHIFDEEMQVVAIWLKPGYYNAYWHYRKDKAMMEEELPFADWLDLEEYELKMKLGIGGMAGYYAANRFNP